MSTYPDEHQWARWATDPCTAVLLEQLAKEVTKFRTAGAVDEANARAALDDGHYGAVIQHTRSAGEMEVIAGALDMWVTFIKQRVAVSS